MNLNELKQAIIELNDSDKGEFFNQIFEIEVRRAYKETKHTYFEEFKDELLNKVKNTLKQKREKSKASAI